MEEFFRMLNIEKIIFLNVDYIDKEGNFKELTLDYRREHGVSDEG